MSKYTTGEIAKLCGVSVRTVQYYDSRNILIPSELSEGGRRLYSEEDLNRMKIICFLRDIGFSLNSIEQLFSEENPEKVILILLEQHKQMLLGKQKEQQKKLNMIEDIKHELKGIKNFSVESIGDIANVMKQKKKLRKMRWLMLLTGIPVSALECLSIILWITSGLWWLFVIWALVAILWGIIFSVYYFKHIVYLCPECHEVFKPNFKEAFWANHTPKTRKLTCPKCNKKIFCVEVYADDDK